MSFPFLDYESSFFTNEELLFLAGASGGGGVEHTIINNPATFTTDLAKPLRRLLIPFTSESGLTGLNICRTGKNLAKMEYGYVPSIVSGADTTTQGQRTGFIEINNTSDYVASFGLSNDNYVLFYDSGKTYLGSISVTKTTPKKLSTYSNYSSAKYIKLRSDTRTEDPLAMLEIGTTATAYEPYSGTIISVSWQTEAGAVNEGALDALTGVLTVTSPESKTVQLDPVSLSTLKGYNAIWTDTNGDNTIVYLKKT